MTVPEAPANNAANPDVVFLSNKPQDKKPDLNEIEIPEEIQRMQYMIGLLMRQYGIRKVEVTSKQRTYVDTVLGTTYTFHNNNLIQVRNG